MSIATSALYIPICLLAGVLYAAALYIRDRRSDLSRPIRWIAASTRFLVVSLLAFLLLSPMISTERISEERPVLVLAMDKSQSMGSGSDSATVRNKVPALIESISQQLADRYDLQTVSFGSDVTRGIANKFDDAATDFSMLFSNLKSQLVNRRQSTVVVFSDGLINQGTDPVFATSDARFNIFTVACGDSTPVSDLLVRSIKTNKIAFTGSSFPIEVVMNATNLAGGRSNLKVTVEGAPAGKDIIAVNNNKYSHNHYFSFTPTKPGILRITAEATPIAKEFTTANNTMVTYLEVLDSRRKILILGSAPHPDLGALRQILESEKQFETEVVSPPLNLPDPANYNLVVAHQLPSLNYPLTDFFTRTDQLSIPILFIIGNLTNLNAFNNLLPPVTIHGATTFVNASVSLSDDFSLFLLPATPDALWRNLPPLSVPFGNYKVANGSEILMYQIINGLITERPLVVLGSRKGNRAGVITGEGVWQQLLAQRMESPDDNTYATWLLKTLHYLAMREPKQRLTVEVDRTIRQFEAVRFEASLLNKSFEMFNTPELSLLITDEAGKTFPHKFARQQNRYILNAGRFPTGRYSYKATVESDNDPLHANGGFVVLPANLEQQSVTADYSLLRRLAAERGGKMLPLDEADQIIGLLRSSDQGKPILFFEEKITELISLPIIFILIVGLLTGEWVLRRWGGSY